jgi:hypothetical protein
MSNTLEFGARPKHVAATQTPVEIFDPPMCCPTGMCGPTIDPALMEVNEMILALQAEGISVARYQMTTHAQVIANNRQVFQLLREQQLAALPLFGIDFVSQFPHRSNQFVTSF